MGPFQVSTCAVGKKSCHVADDPGRVIKGHSGTANHVRNFFRRAVSAVKAFFTPAPAPQALTFA